MPRGIPADRTHKAEIVAKIRGQGLSVSAASAQYQLSSKTIYACCEKVLSTATAT